MFRKFLALLLCLTLSLSPALAVGEEESGNTSAAYAASSTLLFPKINTYTPFSDVKSTHWAYSYVRLCYETGLMIGQGGGRFVPDSRITNGEVSILAARIHAAIHQGSFEENTVPAYKGAVTYLNANGIQTGTPTANATRQSFFKLLAAVVPDRLLSPINRISALPDTQDTAVLKFYNAGILTGTDKYGTFDAAKSLTRAECATMAARVVDSSLRQVFIPAGQVPASPYPDDAVVLTVNGTPVTFDLFSETLLSLINETQNLYQSYGLVFSWDGNYGMESWPQFFKEATTHSVAADVLAAATAAELGCAMEDLPYALFGTPTQAELNAYAAEHGITASDAAQQELLVELVLEEKLSVQLSQWVDRAEIITTALYDTLNVQELWESFG